ncbi:MAG: MFS transporter [Clostridia bacterium]|nr:MFS transporter [Clostridia bacterium]
MSLLKGSKKDSEQPVTDTRYHRRYVGLKETVAYVLDDTAQSLNISQFNDRYIYDVVKIDFNYLAIYNFVGTIWDIINDTFIGVIVERTRTRFGKFRPYVLLGQVPLTILGLWFWLLPFLFPNTAENYLPKFVFYFLMQIITETAGTFTSIARSGFMSTITPDPQDRTRLITLNNMASRLVEEIPNLTFTFVYDAVIKKNIANLKYLFAGFGVTCAVISACFSMYFVLNMRERVMQSIEKPSVVQGLKAIVNNKPMLITVLSSFLGSFNISQPRTNYYIDVLGAAKYKVLVGIPALPLQFISYAFVGPLRKRFSTKVLWIFEDMWTDMLWLTVFGIGSINKNFMKKKVILPTMAIEEVLEMCVYGLRRVIPAEIENESMDYCEWKNGYRAEAMIGVAKSMLAKLQNAVMGAVNNIVMGKIGYVQGLENGAQTDRTKWWIFALGTGVPIITSVFGIVPKFFYPLNQEKRLVMYDDLRARREKISALVENASADELAEIAKAELEGQFINNTKI